ncbi:MAG: hypothetical protein ACI936_000394 [Paraglaciecola sp.]|jgi:hypothetical protein
MDKIKAVVLTYDKNRALTDHMIVKYNNLWPDHPFKFRVPYQDLAPTLEGNNIEYVKSPSDIKGTVLNLLKDLDDEELIYWCIDDKYPIKLNVSKIKKLYNFIRSEYAQNVDALLFCRCRGMLKKSNLFDYELKSTDGDTLLERRNYHQIWIHQFVKVKVIREMFLGFPDEILSAKVMDDFKDDMSKPLDQKLFVTSKNHAVFGESATRGVLTKNCSESIKALGLTHPNWAEGVTQDEIFMGNENDGILKRAVNKLTKRFK